MIKQQYNKQENYNIEYADDIAGLIKNMTNVNVFEQSRRTDIIELRSLFVYLLREVEGMTYYGIRDYFASKGKSYDHSTALHAYNNYKMYKKYNPKLQEYFDILVSKSTSSRAIKCKAKAIIDASDTSLAEIFNYMIQEKTNL